MKILKLLIITPIILAVSSTSLADKNRSVPMSPLETRILDKYNKHPPKLYCEGVRKQNLRLIKFAHYWVANKTRYKSLTMDPLAVRTMVITTRWCVYVGTTKANKSHGLIRHYKSDGTIGKLIRVHQNANHYSSGGGQSAIKDLIKCSAPFDIQDITTLPRYNGQQRCRIFHNKTGNLIMNYIGKPKDKR